MNILGVSGLEHSVSFKKAHWPGLSEREYRMSQGFDAAAALVMDGTVVAAAAEERFSRSKHSAAFPVHAARYCLKEAGISPCEIDEIAHAFDYQPYQSAYALNSVTAQRYHQVYSRDIFATQVTQNFPEIPLDRSRHVNHHLAHAASAYFTSGWDECLVAVIDGMGEVHGASVYHAHDGQLTVLHHTSAYDSIGILYSLVTLHLGFDFNADEYKIMGLAPYGDTKRFRSFFDHVVQFSQDGLLRIPLLRMNRTLDERENFVLSRRYLSQHLIGERKPDDAIIDDHRDVAAALQECLDRVLQSFCGYFSVKTGLRRLALAGGVALNCTANGKLLRSGLFDEVYVQPAAGDDGAALGAALYRASLTTTIPKRRSPVPFWGPSYCKGDIDRALTDFADRVEIVHFGDVSEMCDAAASGIAKGQVVGWYQGRMEFGPRALGHRSILADPGNAGMRDRINAMVKRREAFRPFAPAVSLEEVDYWFDVSPMAQLPYMIMSVDVRGEHRHALPAITHINGSARVQTVSAESNKDFHTLLRAVGRATGREMVLNTSFNVKGQPIVNTPREAVETFLATDMDALFLEAILVHRK
jgi:carbamoyltransferase